MRFDGVSLDEVLLFLSTMTGVEFALEEDAEERVQRAIVRLTREESTVPALLDELLSFDPELRWEAREGKVRILGRKP
ncbi:MAG: hypothetical protein HUU06_07480 [Planctomycetaceae bacterium]|nr:hypothetical protein [Planctomycetaceae bacterium]